MALFKGCGVAMVTPFTQDGINYESLEKLIEYQLGGGTDAIFVLGTTGEPSTMTDAEREDVIKFTISKVRQRIPVIVGTGSNNTAEAVESSKRAERLGAQGLLVVTPYYNKCTQNGLVAHYSKICENVGIPVLAYNVPTRTKVNIEPQTAKRLCSIKNMSGIKEASGDIDQIQALAAAIEGGMDFYIGDDSLATVSFCLGAVGLISVAANVVPKVMSDLTKLCLDSKFVEARALQFKLMPFMSSLFCEVNPIPAKAALSFMGIDCGVPRLPLTEIESEHKQKMKDVMKALGFIK